MIAGIWAHDDSAAAGAWAQRLPVGAERLLVVEAVAAEWRKYSEAALRAWAEQLEPAEREKIGKVLD